MDHTRGHGVLHNGGPATKNKIYTGLIKPAPPACEPRQPRYLRSASQPSSNTVNKKPIVLVPLWLLLFKPLTRKSYVISWPISRWTQLLFFRRPSLDFKTVSGTGRVHPLPWHALQLAVLPPCIARPRHIQLVELLLGYAHDQEVYGIQPVSSRVRRRGRIMARAARRKISAELVIDSEGSFGKPIKPARRSRPSATRTTTPTHRQRMRPRERVQSEGSMGPLAGAILR